MPSSLDQQLTAAWTEELDAVDARLAPHFGRAEVRDHARAYVRGLLSGAERKNGWQLAETAGHATPYGLQHLLGRARWDADAVRDALRGYVMERRREPTRRWRWWTGPAGRVLDLGLLWNASVRRFDPEHPVRSLKQAFGWYAPACATPSRPTGGRGWLGPPSPSCGVRELGERIAGCPGSGAPPPLD